MTKADKIASGGIDKKQRLMYNSFANMKTLPARIYICPVCGYNTCYRWVLKNHLRNVHDLPEKYAREMAAANEYLANPRYYRIVDESDEDD